MKTTNASCNDPIKNRIARKRAATDLTPETPAATEHNPPALLGPTCEAPPGSGDMIIESLADVVSKLADECEESAVALCKAARTLQRGTIAEVRNLCRPWDVQMGRRIDGKYKRRDLGVFKSELTAAIIEKAREHLRTKATEAEQRQHDATENASTKFACSDIRRWMRNLKMNEISIIATPAKKKTNYADIASFVVKAPLI